MRGCVAVGTFSQIMVSLPLLVCGLIFLPVLYTDLRARVIPNNITIPAILCGLFFHLCHSGLHQGSLFAVKGLVVGAALVIIPFLLGGMGGGDVKLLAALGAWLGAFGVLHVFFYGATIGALIALALVVTKKHRLRLRSVWNDIVCFIFTGKRLTVSGDKDVFPYTVPIAMGFLIYAVWGGIV